MMFALAALFLWASPDANAYASNHAADAHHAHDAGHTARRPVTEHSMAAEKSTGAASGSSHDAGHPSGCFGPGARSHDQQHECCGDSVLVSTTAASRPDRDGLLVVFSNQSNARITTILLNFLPTGPPLNTSPYSSSHQQSWRTILHGDAPRLRI